MDTSSEELQQFVANETQKARIQQVVHNMTDVCWKKCFASSSMKGNTLTSAEESCTKNCVNRFLDGNSQIIKELERYRADSGMGN